jgi:hypothetical protein
LANVNLRIIPVFRAEPGTLVTFLPNYRWIPNEQFSKNYKSKAAVNIGLAVRIANPGIGTGNPGAISNVCAVIRVSMILP